MATMTIRHIDDGLKQRLRVQAAQHGRSMEEEVRDILCTSLAMEKPRQASLAESIRARMGPLGGVDLDLPRRQPIAEPPDLGA